MKSERMFMVMMVLRDIKVSAFGTETSVPLNFEAGMVGMIPIFSTRESAEAFSDGMFQIVEIESAAKSG